MKKSLKMTKQIQHGKALTLATTTLTDLQTIARPGRITATDAWQGTNLQAALKTPHAVEVRTACIKMIFDVVRFLDCKKTLQTDDDVFFTFESLVADFPVLKLTEWKYVTDGMKSGKYGKFYERLKAQEFREAFIKYESEERTEILERANRVEHAVEIPHNIVTMMKEISSCFMEVKPVRKKFSGFAGKVKEHLHVDDATLKVVKQEMQDRHADNPKENTASTMGANEGTTPGAQTGDK